VNIRVFVTLIGDCEIFFSQGNSY